MVNAVRNSGSALCILIAIILMPINWLLETLKWYLLLNRDADIPFRKCIEAVLGGLALSMNTPNRIGEYFGRILYLEKGRRFSGAHYSIVSGFSQLLITLLAGFSALHILLIFYPFSTKTTELLVLLSSPVSRIIFLITLFIILMIYFNYGYVVRLLSKSLLFKRFTFMKMQFPDLEKKLLIHILLISLIRFMIFTTQYILIWKALGLTFDCVQGAAIVSVIYLVMAIVPTIAIAELGIRGKVALWVAGIYTTQLISVTTGTVFIWLLNLMLPAVMGTLFLWNLKWKEKQ
jgi:hypothetical protein